MDIRPIRNESDHAAALKEIENLWDAEEGSADADKLEVLAILVEDYEAKAFPVPAAPPIDVLKYAITEMGRSQKELAEILGSRSHASEVLAGTRRLTTAAIHKISKAWHIPAGILVAPYELKRVA